MLLRNIWFNAKNKRYYQVDMFEDLCGDWIMVKKWWGPKRSGREQFFLFLEKIDGLVELERTAKRRKHHGYEKIC